MVGQVGTVDNLSGIVDRAGAGVAVVEGAQVAYGIVRDIAEGKGGNGKKVVAQLDTEFAAITALLDQYKSGDGYVSYTELSTSQVKELSDEVNALSEPLSQLTSIIVK